MVAILPRTDAFSRAVNGELGAGLADRGAYVGGVER
jgi:hypothetical protein